MTISCRHYRDWRQLFKPCTQKSYHENQNKKMHYRVHTCSVNRDFPVFVKKNMFQLQGFSCFSNNFSLFWLHSFPVLITFFPCLLYRVFYVLLKSQIYRDFPLLVTTFLCFNYRVFPALITPFPCFGYIISLYWLQLFYVSITGFSLL